MKAYTEGYAKGLEDGKKLADEKLRTLIKKLVKTAEGLADDDCPASLFELIDEALLAVGEKS